ncbi:35527_t:CDS:2, partial [Gigaspora margarita]
MLPKKVQPVQLCCLVHGDPEISVFSIKISKSENVDALKSAIMEKQRSFFDNIAPQNLKLWSVNVDLITENSQRAALSDLNADITSVLCGQLLNPLESIEEKFPTLPSIHIHVIVELPASSNVANKWGNNLAKFILVYYMLLMSITEFQSESSMKQTIDLFTDTTQQFRQFIDKCTKKRKVSLSKIGQADLDELLNRFSLDKQGYRVIRQGYLSYLKSIITLTSEIYWYDPKLEKDLLFLDNEALLFSVSGMTDVIIADKLFAKVHDLHNGIHVGFEIKKKIQNSHIHQAISELIIANIILQFPVLIVLTDLINEWIFFWLSNNKKVIQCPATLLHAIDIIETALVRDTDGSIGDATVTNPIATQINFQQLLTRPKVDFKFEDDVANMNDVIK